LGDAEIEPILCTQILNQSACSDDENKVEAEKERFKIWTVGQAPMIRIAALASNPQAAARFAEAISHVLSSKLDETWKRRLGDEQKNFEQRISDASPRERPIIRSMLQEVMIQNELVYRDLPLMVKATQIEGDGAHEIWPQPKSLLLASAFALTILWLVCEIFLSATTPRSAGPGRHRSRHG
jgi:hypothetical protein